jgi:hypothetical protein
MTSRPRPTVIRGTPDLAVAALRALAILGALAGVGAGCGNGSSDPTTTADAADDFVGTWRYDQWSSVLQCPGSSATDQPPQPNKTFARGITSALVDLSPSPLLDGVFCDFGFDVAFPIATAQSNQTCAVTGVDTFTIDQKAGNGPPLWTFTLNSATTAEEIVQGTLHIQGTGTTETCSWNLAAHLTRVSKD